MNYLDVVDRARNNYEKKLDAYDRILMKRDGLLAENDRRLQELREKRDEAKSKAGKEQSKRVTAHRNRVDTARKKRDARFMQHINDAKERAANRIKRLERVGKGITRKKLIQLAVCILAIFIVIMAMEVIVPGSKLKKNGTIDDTPIEDKVGILPDAGYEDSAEETEERAETEEQLLWNLLMEHFDGNKTAVLGVMCNLNAESGFRAANLEDYNNQIWGIDDDTYTDLVNRNTIDRQDFLESRNGGSTNGYYNSYNQWVNRDGGYGYAQYTAYENKELLYMFAEGWFGPGGEGEGYRFDIGDPKMQAHYIVHLLESDNYSDLDNKIRSAGSVVDACYFWLKMYEKPYDPYADNYYTLAFDRAAAADAIETAVEEGYALSPKPEKKVEEW